MAIPKFQQTPGSFYTDLRQRVNDYFKEIRKSPAGNFKLYLKAAILLIGFTSLYIHLVFFTPAAVWAIAECVLLGCIVAAIGFNVMHDGAHGSFSNRKWINTMAASSLNILGGNSFMWDMKHNVIHHAFTNVDGVDDDIDIQPWMRMSRHQKKYPLHKYQHLYFWFFYSLLYLSWIFLMDYQKYFKRKIGNIPIKKMNLNDHLVFWSFKVVNLALFIGIPVILPGFTPWLIGFIVFAAVTGFVISIVFQLAHTVEHTSFAVPDAHTGKIEDEWAIHQLKTTANFATRNKLVTWLVGGLNFQIEHHLFPKVSHIHYPAISAIIKKVCREYNIVYIEYPKVRYAVYSHINFLRQMGRV
jgi:linoleoyl-CoA desaturase